MSPLPLKSPQHNEPFRVYDINYIAWLDYFQVLSMSHIASARKREDRGNATFGNLTDGLAQGWS